MPAAADVGLVCTNVRMLDGKRPIFIDHVDSTFFFPYLHIRFLEIPAGEVQRHMAQAGAGPGRPRHGRPRRRRSPGTTRQAGYAVVVADDGPSRSRRTSPHPTRTTTWRSTRTSSSASATSSARRLPRMTAPGDRRDDRRASGRCYTPRRHAQEPRDRGVARQGADDRALPRPGLPGPRLVRPRPRPAREPGQGQVRRGRGPRLRARVRHLRGPAQAGHRHREGGPGRGRTSTSPPTSTARARRSPGTWRRPPTSPRPRPAG